MGNDRHFYSVLGHLNDFYGISMKDDQFENIAMHAWDHIGNKEFKLYVFNGTVVDNKCALPCNVDIIEAVFAAGQDVRRSTGTINDDAWVRNSIVEEYIEWRRNKTEFMTASGHFEDYDLEGNTLNFKRTGFDITILYKGVLADETGLPSLNFKEVDAIAKYCAWVVTQKQAMITKDKSTWEIAMMLKQQWQVAVDDARTPIYLNQNDMDELLNVQSSWDRKRFGLSYKIYK